MAMNPPAMTTLTTSSLSASARRTAPEGERLEADTRLVVAPDAGVFEPAIDLAAGNRVAAGQVVGHLTSGPSRLPVISPFSGRSGAAMAWHGERLQAHQPVMWLSLDAGTP